MTDTVKIADFYRGDTKVYKFTFTGQDITGWAIWFTMKNDSSDLDEDAVLQVTATAGGNVLDDPVNGIMYLTLTSSQTNLLEPNEFFYDFQRVIATSSPADVRTLLSGRLRILTDISRTIA